REASLSSLFNIDRPLESLSVSLQNAQQNDIMTLGNTTYLLKRTKASTVKSGIDYKYHQSTYLFSEDDLLLLSGNDAAHEITAFGENTWQHKGLALTFGARLTYYSADKGWYLDPKMQLAYTIDEHHSFKASAHYAHQYTRQINYESRLGQSSDYLVLADGNQFPVGSSLQFMLGHTFRKNNWLIDMELYHKNLDGTLEYALQIPGFDGDFSSVKNRSYKIFSGKGRVYGLDLLVRKEWKHFETQIAYTLSKSLRQFKEIRRNLPFPAQDDRRHQLKWLSSYHLGRFKLSANFIYSSGKPYFAINELSAQNTRSELPRTAIRNLPSYQRIDLGIDYSFHFFSQKSTLGFSCFNITDHQNVKYLQYIFSIPTDSRIGAPLRTVVGSETTLLGRTLNFRFRLEF
ncbi:MAG: TonB-dependent receptor, partial [Saprospiraceae bacterium]|nr:TonB-dependent receptor [Saprospiraceae bacterium]